jgi:hypothetical protein
MHAIGAKRVDQTKQEKPDIYRYPAEDLDKDYYVQLVAAWVQARMEADRSLLQLTGFLLAAAFVVLTNNKEGQFGPKGGWVFIVILLGIAAACLVAALKGSAEFTMSLVDGHTRQMAGKHGNAMQDLTQAILAADRAAAPAGPQDDLPPPEATHDYTAADHLKTLDQLAVAMVVTAGLCAATMLIYETI